MLSSWLGLRWEGQQLINRVRLVASYLVCKLRVCQSAAVTAESTPLFAVNAAGRAHTIVTAAAAV
jgi:hypothetical protein